MDCFKKGFKRVLVMLVLSLPLVCAGVPAQADGQGSAALEAAGKLRSLSQRQAKLYLQIRLGIEREASVRWLAEAVRSFDENLLVVERAAQGEAGSERIVRRITGQWEGFRKVLTEPMDVGRAATVSADAELIAIAAQALAVRFDLAQDSPVFRLVDLASRNDMLAQRLARVYMQIRAGENSPATRVDLEQTRKEFSAGLNELLKAEGNTKFIQSRLELARQQWIFFEMAVNERDRSFDFARRDVATTSERISQMMNAASQGYVQQISAVAQEEAPARLARRP